MLAVAPDNADAAAPEAASPVAAVFALPAKFFAFALALPAKFFAFALALPAKFFAFALAFAQLNFLHFL